MTSARINAQPTWLLARVHARSRRLLVEAFAPYGLRPLHYRALSVLAEHGELAQADLGRLLELDRKDVALAVDVLEEERLVERTPDPHDGRRKKVALTAGGRRLMPSLDAALESAQTALLSPLPTRDQRAFVELLGRLGGEPGTVHAGARPASG